MSHFRNHTRICLLSVALFVTVAGPARGASFSKVVIDASATFECAGIGDIDGDGKNEIVSGSYWYDYPSLERHFICDIPANSGYLDDFSNSLVDVDGDGDLDIVSVTWFSRKCVWRENPRFGGERWNEHVFDKPGNVETAYLADLSGDGLLDLVPNVMGQVTWYERKRPQEGPPYWEKHQLGKEGAGHGLGTGDINGDGRLDLITPHGWYESPPDPRNDPWSWHPEFGLGPASVPVLAFDVDGDGLTDIVWGMGHNYGLYWLKQQADPEKQGSKWVRYDIDHSWSQSHALFLVDLDLTGQPGVLTGKRHHAHNGNDPGGNEPTGVYYYTYDRETDKWAKTTIQYGNRVGFGLMPAVGDLDGDGDADIVCSGKSGLYLLINQAK